jgi:hypothetical protein
MKRPHGAVDEKDERDITDMPQKRFYRSRARKFALHVALLLAGICAVFLLYLLY